jgi:hypothetical protein
MAHENRQDSDLDRSATLLSGIYNKNGLHRYLDREEENQPRKAIARLLLSDQPLERALRVMLAALFDPDAPQVSETGAAISSDEQATMELVGDRILQFGFRSKKRRPQLVRDIIMESWINVRIATDGISVEAALAEAADKFGVSADTAKKVRQRAKGNLTGIKRS